MVALSVATDHFAQFPAGDSGGSGDIDYRRVFFLEKKKLLPCVCVTGFWFSVVMGSVLRLGVCLRLCLFVPLPFRSFKPFPAIGACASLPA